MTFGRLARLAPLVSVLAAGCFATRNDVRLLQADVLRLEASAEQARREAAARDSMRAAQVRDLALLVGVSFDSIRTVGDNVGRLRAEVLQSLLRLEEQIIAVQARQGASADVIRQMLADLESRTQARTMGDPPGGDTLARDTTFLTGAAAAAADPGPLSRYQLALDQLRGGSLSTARMVLEDVLSMNPPPTMAADALFHIARTFEEEGNDASADSVYQMVVQRYPESARAPTALWKRASALAQAGQNQPARQLLERLISEYPRSDEELLARDLLTRLPR